MIGANVAAMGFELRAKKVRKNFRKPYLNKNKKSFFLSNIKLKKNMAVSYT